MSVPTKLALTLATLLISPAFALDPIQLHWLDKDAPTLPLGTAFGIPFKQGDVQKATTFSLTDPSGEAFPLQTWPLAYWPDGSIKWEAFAFTANTPTLPPARDPFPTTYTLTASSPAASQSDFVITETPDTISFRNGLATYTLARSGTSLFKSITMNDRVVATDGTLVATEQFRASPDAKPQDLAFTSSIDKATVEQTGSVRTVIKVEGHYATADKSWLPFTLRLYFYAHSPTVQIVHSFVFDGDQNKDFLTSLGLRFIVPLREPAYNRHVRFAGDAGMWQEPVQPVVGRRIGANPATIAGVQGQPLDVPHTVPQAAPGGGGRAARPEDLIKQMAVWNDFHLTQLSPDGFTITKRTSDQSSPLAVTAGHRAQGLAFLGDTQGGIALALKNFWQMHPTELEINNAGASSATLTCWLYSPQAQPMDLRHYSTTEHGLEAAYEDITPGLSTPTGIARTHELTLTPFANVPPAATLQALAQTTANTPRLVATPEYYHSVKAFGVWSLPNTTNPTRAAIEAELAKALDFYKGEIDRRRWYGFWNFGDVMHSYDASRHEWRYDIGGYAWANTELMSDLWLWTSFMRTGRADIFRMAEAMTRNTQEVDVYHIGPMRGLGSRHNVSHWGDGAKELRVAQAALKRHLYYLTTDERMGDLLTEVVDADQALLTTDPLRKVEEDRTAPSHVRAGPDWFALCSNWLTAWERTGDKKYLDYVNTGINCFAAMKNGILTSENYGYDPATKKLTPLHDKAGIPHLATLQGSPEFWLEFTPVLNNPKWTQMYLQYAKLLQSPPEEHTPILGNKIAGDRLGPHFARVTAYAARELKDDTLAARAWSEFLKQPIPGKFDTLQITGPEVPSPVLELHCDPKGTAGVSSSITNDTAQWSLNAIELLDLLGDKAPQLPGNRP